MRAAAVSLGLPTKSIFSDSEFIWRSSADKWVIEAEETARKRGERLGYEKGTDEAVAAFVKAMEASK